ncbi:MAG TPA: terminase family protein [Terriglobales bacterium]|nr:terminase family protein [Terriglobales bacterium]
MTKPAKGRSVPKAARAQIVSRKYTVPPVIQLRPYQQAWIDDPSRFCGAVKSARIGFSYGTGLRRLFRCLEHENRTATVLSASHAQSVEFIGELSKNVKAIGATMQLFQDEFFVDIDGKSEILQQRIQLPNGARIIALPANPRTARGYPGDAVLDEFGHHQDSYSIWAAIARQVALGNELDVLSTPNGQIGKFYDLAKEFGLVDGVAPKTNPVRADDWSWHWVDVHMAIAQGCPINLRQMRNLFKDEQTFSQEFLCVFLQAVGSWLTNELIQLAENPNATLDWPAGYTASGPLFAGIDVARDRNKSVLWLDEKLGDVAWTRLVLRLVGMPFPQQHNEFLPWVEMATRTAVDATGMGVGIFDYLDQACRGKVIGVNFAGKNDKGVAIKTHMAINMKNRLEKGLDRIPYDPDIRAAWLSIKRMPTATGVKFDAPQIETDTPVAGGQRRKAYGHADEFWAKCMANLAAESAPAAVAESTQEEMVQRAARGIFRGDAARRAMRDRGEEVAADAQVEYAVRPRRRAI